MTKVKSSVARKKRKKKVLDQAKGFWGGRSKRYRMAKESVARSMAYATEHRRKKKRDFKSLWTIRINAACKQRDLSYSVFMGGLKKAGISLNRKMLAFLALEDTKAFDELVELSKSSEK